MRKIAISLISLLFVVGTFTLVHAEMRLTPKNSNDVDLRYFSDLIAPYTFSVSDEWPYVRWAYGDKLFTGDLPAAQSIVIENQPSYFRPTANLYTVIFLKNNCVEKTTEGICIAVTVRMSRSIASSLEYALFYLRSSHLERARLEFHAVDDGPGKKTDYEIVIFPDQY